MNSVRVLVLGGFLLLGACVEPTPPPQPQPPAPAPVPPPPPPAPPPTGDWRDVPLSRGSWSYRQDASGSQALFGLPNFQPSFVVRCDQASRTITLSRQGTTSGNTMTVRTSFGQRNFPLSVQTDPAPYVYSRLPAGDTFLDMVAFSRGRFTVEVPGTEMLIIPSWQEPARVIEDCRG